MDRKFEDFEIGDVYTFKKVFKKNDFDLFSRLSGDRNPLHYDENYSKQTTFEKPIVPIHLAAAPLSSVAGMVFPGLRSLYLSHEIKSHLPIFFDEEVTYSSKIVDMNYVEKILILRTIIFKNTDIMLSSIQRIQVRDDDIDTEGLKSLQVKGSLLTNSKTFILITGAGGEIGHATAMQLAKSGKNLILLFRKKDKKNAELAKRVMEYSPDVRVIEMDLSKKGLIFNFDKFLNINKVYIETVIFAASPKIDSPINTQMTVNYSSLKSIVECCLPFWLERQHGKIIFLSSSAVHYHPDGLENYATAKAAGVNYLDGIRKRFSEWGINARCLALGKVDTKFSTSLITRTSSQMMPEQVAENILNILEDESSTDFYYWLENTGLNVGSYDFIRTEKSDPENLELEEKKFVKNIVTNRPDKLKDLIMRFFNLGANTNWDNVGLGLTAGWDSLRHIEFILLVEENYSIKFSSEEIDLTTTFYDLNNLLNKKLT